MIRLPPLFLFLLLLGNTFFTSCRKDKIAVSRINCLIDSVTLNDGYSFHFKYKGNQVEEIRSYLNGDPQHIISHTYTGNLLISKAYYFIPIQSFTRKYEYRYTNDLLTSFTHYRFNSARNVYEKVRSSLFAYTGKQLSTARISSFNSTDSINPIGNSIYYYTVANGVTDSAFSDSWNLNGISYKYLVVNKENPLRNNYFFLTDPITIHRDLLFDPIYLPVLMNEKYTITINKCQNFNYSEVFQQIRTGVNNFGLPLFVSWDPWHSDYYYKCNQ